MPAAEWSRVGKHRRRSERHGRPQPWSRPALIQVVSHVATGFSIACCASILQPHWAAESSPSVRLIVFWVIFVVTLALYLFVCYADTRYHERSDSRSDKFEARKCEECSPRITHPRVKHCQTCCKCVENFDHHCRYLNICIGGRTYYPWFCFVFGLFLLMGSCCIGASRALAEHEAYALGEASPVAFFILVGLQAAVSALLALFLMCLMGQHIYFICEGITTLEYVKDQAPGFPSLPPKGWREAVQYGECWNCGEELETMDADDPSEVWYCAICQTDVGKAGVEFFTCGDCDNINVCPLCALASKDPSVPVVTYRVSSLRRQANSSQLKAFHRTHSVTSRHSTMSQRERKLGRRTLSAVVAAVEGHSGDPIRRPARCSWCSEREAEAETGPDNHDASSSSSDG